MEPSPSPSPDDILGKLHTLDGWTAQDDTLSRTIVLRDFQDAIAFVMQIAMVAEKLNHHPAMSISYNSVRISCWTHDAGPRLTQLDFALASRISQLADRFLQTGK